MVYINWNFYCGFSRRPLYNFYLMLSNNKLVLNSILALSFLSLSIAYFIQYVLGHEPCNLCLIERIPYLASLILISIIFIINKFENSIKENKYEDVLSEMFSEMIFSSKFDNLKEFVIKRALSLKFEISKTLRRNAIWFDGHCLEPILKSLNIPILLMQSTTINKFGKRIFIDTRNLSDIPYIDFVKENCANSFDKTIFQKTGHYISVEKSEDFNKNLLNWLLNKIFKDK